MFYHFHTLHIRQTADKIKKRDKANNWKLCWTNEPTSQSIFRYENNKQNECNCLLWRRLKMKYSFRSVCMCCGTNILVCKPIKAEKRFGCASRKCNCARSIYLHHPTIENAVYCSGYLILLLLLLLFLLSKSILRRYSAHFVLKSFE